MLEQLLKWFFKFRGWKLGNNIPPEYKKCVILLAPHTSAWDFVYGSAAKLLLNLDVKYLMKKEVFSGPLKNLFLKLGGVPIDRSTNAGLTPKMIEYIKSRDHAIVVYPAEGTRKRVTRWRKGFYYAALGAQVPIVMAYLDYKEKEAGMGPSFMPSGDIKKDFEIIRNFYKNITPYKSENFALPE
jgi:1-acyl-sn-glycerol-3-phosphate acyltransferase